MHLLIYGGSNITDPYPKSQSLLKSKMNNLIAISEKVDNLNSSALIKTLPLPSDSTLDLLIH